MRILSLFENAYQKPEGESLSVYHPFGLTPSKQIVQNQDKTCAISGEWGVFAQTSAEISHFVNFLRSQHIDNKQIKYPEAFYLTKSRSQWIMILVSVGEDLITGYTK